MHIQFELSDGELIRSDEFFPSGPAELENIILTFQDWPAMGHLGVEVGGRMRYYNPIHVRWAEIVDY